MGSVDAAEIDNARINQFQRRLIGYYYSNGRKHLPWRQTKDPWKILLAEMLLRKTAAAQIIEIYSTLADMAPRELAEAETGEIKKILMPLGIFNERARLIQEAAAKTAEYGTAALQDEKFLKSISGVGPYVVNTVQCFAFGMPKPALDRNMIRVLERVFSIKSNKKRPHTDKELWRAAEQLVPADEPEKYNWGVLDLAADVCRPRNPKCSRCVLADICDYAEKLI